MSTERVVVATLFSAERIRDLQHEGLSREEATKSHLLDVYELQICGHDTLELKSNRDDIIGDGLLRAQNLERLYRGFLYVQRHTDQDGNVIADVSVGPHEEELFSINTYKRNYEMIRKRHNEMFAKREGDTKTLIPEFDFKIARIFMAGQVAGKWLELVPAGRSLRDIELHKMEDSKMFRFPPTEFQRKPGEVEKEKIVLKQTAFSLLLNERRNRGDSPLFSVSDLLDVYKGLVDNNPYKGEVGMYLTRTSAQAFIREQMEHYGLEEIVVRKEYELDGETHIEEENYYRQIPS